MTAFWHRWSNEGWRNEEQNKGDCHSTFGIPTSFSQEECPRGAEFIISFDSVLPLADFLQNIPDPNLTFFRNVLKFSEQEIQTAEQSAIEYFNTTFGLDFSQSEPNQQGQRIFQNASFAAGQAPFTATTKANHWLVTGSTRSRCFDVRLGWFGISLLGQQVLHGDLWRNWGYDSKRPSTICHYLDICMDQFLPSVSSCHPVSDYCSSKYDPRWHFHWALCSIPPYLRKWNQFEHSVY